MGLSRAQVEAILRALGLVGASKAAGGGDAQAASAGVSRVVLVENAPTTPGRTLVFCIVAPGPSGELLDRLCAAKVPAGCVVGWGDEGDNDYRGETIWVRDGAIV